MYSTNSQPHYQVSAFHDNRLTNDRELDARDFENSHNHDLKTWVGNPMILRCNCGYWHYKYA